MRKVEIPALSAVTLSFRPVMGASGTKVLSVAASARGASIPNTHERALVQSTVTMICFFIGQISYYHPSCHKRP